jgi:hypothetical protein
MIEIFQNARTTWGPVQLTDTQENAFFNGNVFSYEDYLTYDASETKYLYFDCSGFNGENLIVLPPAFSSTAGPVTIEFYSNPTVTANGTELGVSNRRGTSTNTNDAKLYLNVVGNITNNGTRFTGRLVPASGTAPANSSGSQASGDLPFELNTSINYLIVITNTNGAGVIIQTDFTWLEL